MTARTKLEVRDLSKIYEIREGVGRVRRLTALQDVTFDVKEEEFVTIIGPSGCGKSTLLFIIAGLLEKTGGEIRLDGRSITGPGLDRAIVFQEFAIFPWLTVKENIKFGLKQKKTISKDQHEEIARRHIKMVQLEGFEDTYPHRLSGGMKQRVGVARALAYDPALLLMDEPFGALDAQTRSNLQGLLVDIWQEAKKTVVFVTHSVREAVYLSDRVLVLQSRPGKVIKSLEIDIPRPRDETFNMFSEYVAELKETLVLG